jgi:putative copper export protein/methionine-rich copper-binding protein CopC
LLSRALRLSALAGVALAMWPATPAGAHAHLVSSDPPAAAHLANVPEEVTLRFDDPVDVTGTAVGFEAGGREVRVPARATRDPRVVVATFDAAAQGVLGRVAGGVTLDWRALADDGHVTNGSVAFTVAARPAVAAPRASSPTTDATRAAERELDVARTASYAGLFVLCGGLAFLAFVWPDGGAVVRARRLLGAAWVVAMGGTAAGIVAETALVRGVSFARALAVHLLGDVLGTDVGRVSATRGLLLLLVVPLLWALRVQGASAPRSTAWRIAVAAVGVALLRTPGLVAHSGESRFGALGTVADLVHVVGAALWLGGLAFLCAVVLPRRDPDELGCLVPRYSTLAMVSVGAVVIAGTFLAWQLVGGTSAVVHTHYGHVLALKLVLVAGVLAAASQSKRWVDGRLDHAVILGGDARIVRPFVLSVAVEAALALAVLSVVGVLVGTSPGR